MKQNAAVPSRYLSDHLFLLIGTNPLPNYVAAKLLLNPGGKLYLVHSEATRPAAERLFSYWVNQEQTPQYVPVMESDSTNIQTQIMGELNKIGDGQVGLNYTGGTKIMSVYACRTLLSQQGQRPVALSYLDARSNRMFIEFGSEAPFVSDTVLYGVTPSLEHIVGLHAVKLVSEIERIPSLPDLASLFASVHQFVDASTAWRSWCDNTLKLATRTKKPNAWDDEKLLCNVRIALPTDKSLAPVVEKLRQAFNIEQEIFSLATASQQAGFKKIKHLCEWLDGKWLEYHVLHLLQTIAKTRPDCRVHDCGMGIKPKNEPDRPEYDVDIGVMQGYRLYAISCTTDDDKGMCKLKLFEAYERARNMGGEEAHVGLICLNDSPEALERQVGRSWDAADKIRVFGRPDIPDLIGRLADWFKNAGR